MERLPCPARQSWRLALPCLAQLLERALDHAVLSSCGLQFDLPSMLRLLSQSSCLVLLLPASEERVEERSILVSEMPPLFHG